MSLNFHRKTIQAYLDQLARREPVPGGGSAAALTAALGVALISMVANYAIGRKNNTKAVEQKLAKTLRTSETIRKRLLALTSLDAQAYLNIVQARKLNAKAQKKASQGAAGVGKEVCRLCYKALQLTPFLVTKGSSYLVSDVQAAVEFLQAAFNASMVMVKINER